MNQNISDINMTQKKIHQNLFLGRPLDTVVAVKRIILELLIF